MGFWKKKRFLRTEGRTTTTNDGRLRHGISSADSQAELKFAKEIIGVASYKHK